MARELSCKASSSILQLPPSLSSTPKSCFTRDTLHEDLASALPYADTSEVVMFYFFLFLFLEKKFFDISRFADGSELFGR